VDGVAFVRFCDMVWEVCVAALEILVAGGEVGSAGQVVVFAVADGEDAARDAGWIRRINSTKQTERFARWAASGRVDQ
jgi:hypothetical protein